MSLVSPLFYDLLRYNDFYSKLNRVTVLVLTFRCYLDARVRSYKNEFLRLSYLELLKDNMSCG